MRFLDLFSGIGGFRMGLERAGHECVGHVEIDKYANQSYRAIHKPKEREFFHEDITTITDESIRELRDRGIDIIAGGFPCQAFSIAGKRAGFEDTRGTLFFDIARLAREIQPKYLFLENVKGLLNHGRGDTFEVILRALDELGYDAEWQVLNSKHFGVPQNRERVFIIGHLRGSSTRKVFPIGESNGTADELQGQHTGTITTRTGTSGSVGTYIVEGERLSQEINQIGNLIDTDSFGGNPQTGRVYGTDGISPCLNTMGGGGREPKVAIPAVFEQRTDEGARHFKDGVCGTIRAKDSGGDKRVAIPVLTPDRAEKRQNGRRFKEDGDPMFTLTAQDRHGIMMTRNEIKRKTEISHCLMARDYKGLGNQEMTAVLEIKEATKQGFAIAEPGDSINLEQPNSKTRRGRVGKGVANTITTSCNQAVVEPKILIRETDDGFHLCRNDAKKSSIQGTHVTYPDGTSHCLTSAHKPMTIDQQYVDGISDQGRAREEHLEIIGGMQKNQSVRNDGVVPCLTSSMGTGGGYVPMLNNNIRIRKLTPKECWRLQGFPDWAFERAKAAGVSDSQLYKQAGNSVTVNVVYEIAKRLK